MNGCRMKTTNAIQIPLVSMAKLQLAYWLRNCKQNISACVFRELKTICGMCPCPSPHLLIGDKAKGESPAKLVAAEMGAICVYIPNLFFNISIKWYNDCSGFLYVNGQSLYL